MEQVGRPHGDRLRRAERALAHLRIDRRGRSPIEAFDVVAKRLIDVLIALVAEGVGQRLVGRDPIDGRRHRRIPHLLANPNQLMHQPVIAIDRLALAEIADQHGQHRGGQLMFEDIDVVSKGDRILEFEILIVDLIEVPAGLADQREIEAGVVGPVVQACHHRLGGGLRRAPGERRERGIDARRAGFDGGEIRDGRERRRRVRMDADGQLGPAHQRADQRSGGDRRQDARHIFDADPVGAERLQPVR